MFETVPIIVIAVVCNLVFVKRVINTEHHLIKEKKEGPNKKAISKADPSSRLLNGGVIFCKSIKERVSKMS